MLKYHNDLAKISSCFFYEATIPLSTCFFMSQCVLLTKRDIDLKITLQKKEVLWHIK